MSPEKKENFVSMRNTVHEWDADKLIKSDVYSLGVMLY